MKRRQSLTSVCVVFWLSSLSLAARGESASVDDATKAQLKVATDFYEKGLEELEQDNAALALAQFQRSLETVNSPNSRMMVGRALVKLGRFPDAYRELTRTIQHATALSATQKKYKKTIDSAKKELDEFKDKLAYLTLQQGTKATVQGVPVPASEWETAIPVLPGTVHLEFAFSDGKKLVRDITLSPGERSNADIALPSSPSSMTAPAVVSTSPASPPRAQEPSNGIRRSTVGYVFGAVGVVGVGAFVGFGIVGAGSYGNTKANCTIQICPEAAVNAQGSKSLMQGIGYTGLGIGVLGLAAGTWLVLTADKGSARTLAVRVGPQLVELEQRF